MAGIGVVNAKEKSGMTYEAGIYKNDKQQTMPYRIAIPPKYDANKKYPLVLCLHGAGGRGTDNRGRGIQAFRSLATADVVAKHPAFLLAPQCPKGKKWVNSDWKKGSYSLKNVKISEQLKLVMEILAKVRKEFNIDPARIYVTGQSMGGFATWDIIMRYPDLFAAAVPVCGAGDPEMAKKIVKLPVWAFHGDADRTVPLSGSRDMVTALKKLNGNIKYTEFPGVGHGSWKNTWKKKDLITWLFSQQKS